MKSIREVGLSDGTVGAGGSSIAQVHRCCRICKGSPAGTAGIRDAFWRTLGIGQRMNDHVEDRQSSTKGHDDGQPATPVHARLKDAL